MDASTITSVQSGAKLHPRTQDQVLAYGTAGFRRKAADLDHVLYRVGLLSCLRSKAKAAAIGAMITASHNPEDDNGVKIIDPHGEMLEARWEQYATRLVNVSDQDLVQTLDSITATEEIDLAQPAHVLIAMDTRPSSEKLSAALQHGIDAFSAKCTNYGIMTTPQLHYMVRCTNTQGDYGEATEQGYYTKLSKAFHALMNVAQNKQKSAESNQYKPSIFIDAANGVGAQALTNFMSYIANDISITVLNDGTCGKLNLNCGADYVKINQRQPLDVKLATDTQYASFDGDADRIVFYCWDEKFCLLDGDKIATLLAGFLKELIQQTGVLDLDLGIVQTAYANGESARYIRDELGLPVACVPTGVKHLHHRAEQMDIGVYFEANGHGTVLFSEKATTKIRQGADDGSLLESQREAFTCLANFIDLTNQTVGDALSDLLLVQTVLCYRGWDCATWNKTYTELPNIQIKVQVADRSVISTTDAERRTTSPEGLQEVIDNIVRKFHAGRSFVRPSGTEDVVRVYAEGESQADALWLGYEVALTVYKMCTGVGKLPAKPGQAYPFYIPKDQALHTV